MIMDNRQWCAMNLVEKINHYYETRGLALPNFDHAMMFTHTEIAEAYEVYLSQFQWVRNNPESKPVYDPALIGEELGDAIMMLIMAGLSIGEDPVKRLVNKMKRKIEEQ